MARPVWRVTVRSGSSVSREGFTGLGEALAAARREAEEVIATAPLGEVKAIRDYSPAARTKARIEISGRGLVRPPTAGLDVRGDNSILGYRGSIQRKPLPGNSLDQVMAALEATLNPR